VAEIDYTHGYYRELNPLLMGFAALHAGVRCELPEGLRYLELGFGQGLSLNIHAAALAGEFWGVDLNPSHAAQAKEMARASGSRLQIYDASFEAFAARGDLPQFDVIGLHGVWSWISPANRALLTEFIGRQLATGGIVYLSYNTMPGWSAAAPLRELLSLHARDGQGSALGIVERIDASVAFAQALHDAGALYFKANPAVADRLKQLQGQSRHYLAHEYFNADWEPMPFARLHAAMDDARLSFVGSAHILDHIEAIQISAEGRALLAKQSHPVMRETVRDYLVNQQFRRDLFVRGPRRLTATQRMAALRGLRFALCTMPGAVALKAKSALGEVQLSEAIYRPLMHAIQRLTAQQQAQAVPGATAPRLVFPTLGQLEDDLRRTAPAVNTVQLLQALAVLVGLGHLALAQSPERCASAQARCDRLNAWIVAQAIDGGEITHLASPATGGGIALSRLEQLLMLAATKGLQTPALQANFIWEMLQSRGQRLLKQGQPLESAQDHLDELLAQARAFEQNRKAVLAQLGVRLGEISG